MKNGFSSALLADESKIVFSGSAISAVAACMFLLLPIIIGEAANEHLYGEAALGLLASLYLAGFTVSGIASAAFQRRFAMRRLLWVAFITLTTGLGVAAFYFKHFQVLSIGFIAAGVGAGCLYSISFRIIAMASELERAFGWKLFTEQIFAATLFFLLSWYVEGFTILMALIALVVALGASIIRFTPELEPEPVELKMDKSMFNNRGRLSFAYLAALVSVALFMTALSGPWAFLESIAERAGVHGSQFATLGAIGLLLGAGGGLLVAIQGGRFGSTGPLILSTILISILLYFLGIAISLATVFAMLFIPFFWNYALAYQMAVAAQHDPQNSWTSWLSPVIAVGATLGPVSAGWLFEMTGDYVRILLISGVLMVAALVASASIARYRSN